MGGGRRLTIEYSNTTGGSPQKTLRALFALPVRRVDRLETTFERNDGSDARGLRYSHSPSAGGVGWTADFQTNGQQKSIETSAAYATGTTDNAVTLALGNGSVSTTTSTRGSLLYLDKHVYAAQQISSGFMLVDSGGYPGVRVNVNDSVVGRTGKDGTLLVPSVSPYRESSVTLDERDAPLSVRFGPAQRIAPRARSGSIVRFSPSIEHSASIALVDDHGKPILPGSTIRLAGASEEFPVGEGGEAFFTSVRSGPLDLEGNVGNDRCAVHLTVPALSDDTIDLGRHVCAAVALAPPASTRP